jgi:ATP-dependent DNA helicase DinG
MEHRLGKWAVIDIETTGADPAYDQVIDLGFIEFEGITLVRKYSSLVQFDGELSSFIQKLTGITTKMLTHAPVWKEVENHLLELYGVKLLAHNSDFESGFLKKYFDKIDDGNEREEFCDSLYFLGLLFPEYSSLKLEHFIQDWNIRETEAHRGFEDSLDLLKVVLVATALTKEDQALYQFIKLHMLQLQFKSFWIMNFLDLSLDEINTLAKAIDFDLKASVEAAKSKIWPIRFPESEPVEKLKKNFSLEFSGDNIKNIFNEEKIIQTMFKGYKKRDSQISMATRIGQSFKNRIHALIQAPTGTGKTFGYLIPSVLFALEEKKTVLISTGTKTLQHQAFLKDVPAVRQFLGLNQEEVKIKLLVGSSNHLCELLFRQEENEKTLFKVGDDFNEQFTSLYFETIFFHNNRNVNEKKIIRDELPFVLKKKISEIEKKDKEIAVDFRSCSGMSCPFKNNCSYISGLRAAKDAHIIIGNHSLMFSWPKGIPRPAYVIVDEAHRIEDESTQAFSLEIDQIALTGFISALQHAQGVGSLFYLLAQNEVHQGESSNVIKELREETLKAHQMLFDHIVPMSELVGLYFKKMPRYTEIFWNELPMIDRDISRDNSSLAILNHLESMHFVFQTLVKVLLPHASRFDIKNLKNENEIVAFTRFESFYSQLKDYENAFLKLLTPNEIYSRSMKYLEREGFMFSASPVNVGQIVHQELLALSSSVIFTSATLANGNGDTGSKGIEWATGYSYLESERRFKGGFYLPSVYDYQNKTKVFLCDDVPSLYDNNFVPHCIEKTIPLVRKLNGRSLFLFSAKSRFEIAREILLKKFEGQIPLFIQGMGTNVVEDFKRSGSGILLGMESFGEGIDIPGDALQFIFIDKIPDLRMDLVIKERRDYYESHLGNEFTDYYLSHRTRSLHQKLGRLLRTENDFGGVIIVDNRIKGWKGRTMETMVKLMAPYALERATLENAVGEIENFILSHSDHSST